MLNKTLLLVLLILSLAWSPAVFSVCLNGNPSIEQEFSQSVIVCVGRVISEKFTPESKDYFEGSTYRIAIQEVFRGSPKKPIQVFSENSSGRFPMTVGSSYLIFIHKELGRLQVDNCGNSGELSKSANVLSILRKMKPNKGIQTDSTNPCR
jgi:hypothetical protein